MGRHERSGCNRSGNGENEPARAVGLDAQNHRAGRIDQLDGHGGNRIAGDDVDDGSTDLLRTELRRWKEEYDGTEQL